MMLCIPFDQTKTRVYPLHHRPIYILAIDTDGNGYIAPEEVLEFLRGQGQDITEEVYKEINETDKNGDGKITFEGIIRLNSVHK